MGEPGRNAIQSGREIVIRLLERLKQAAQRTGHPIEDYKPREAECLDFVFANLLRSNEAGIDFAAEIVHELV